LQDKTMVKMSVPSSPLLRLYSPILSQGAYFMEESDDKPNGLKEKWSEKFNPGGGCWSTG